MATHFTGAVIFGAGVAGLWTLNRLTQAGIDALLIETGAIGQGQTRYAQGIIHGGTKYALTGHLTGSSESISAMPGVWRDCLAGRGELDLRRVRLLSDHQFLWSTASVTSRLAGFFASHAMRSRTATVGFGDYPAPLRAPGFRGQVYRLDEPVLDLSSLLRALAEPVRDRILAAGGPDALRIGATEKGLHKVELAGPDGLLAIEARALVLAAGRGNGPLLSALGRQEPQMQLRPLKMVALRDAPGDLYAHCLGASTTPRITVTTHTDAGGRRVWYLGGQLAEEVTRGDGAQREAARAELAALLPWFDFADLPLAVLPIDRAEPAQPDGSRPDDIFCRLDNGVMTVWPTKLAFAPRLAAAIKEQLAPLIPAGLHEPPAWARPGYAPLPWEETAWN